MKETSKIDTERLGNTIDWKTSKERSEAARKQGYDFAACLHGRWNDLRSGVAHRVRSVVYVKDNEAHCTLLQNDWVRTLYKPCHPYRPFVPIKDRLRSVHDLSKPKKLPFGDAGIRSDFTASLESLIDEVGVIYGDEPVSDEDPSPAGGTGGPVSDT